MQPLAARISELRRKYAGTPVTATEPVFGYMAAALGLDMRNPRFQLAVMNDTEPSAADIAAFEQDLRSHAVKVLIYNRQTSDALTRHMREIAQQSGIPVVGVTETEPRGEGLPGVDALATRCDRSRARPLAAPAIELDRVVVARAGRVILNEVSATVRSGEFIGVFGPNGAGKTTLLRAILGLLPLLAGEDSNLRPTTWTRQSRRRISAAAARRCCRSAAARLGFCRQRLAGERWGLPLIGRRGATRSRAGDRSG